VRGQSLGLSAPATCSPRRSDPIAEDELDGSLTTDRWSENQIGGIARHLRQPFCRALRDVVVHEAYMALGGHTDNIRTRADDILIGVVGAPSLGLRPSVDRRG
jgi:hypothetical protein